MTANVGSADRTVRWLVGVALILLGVFGVLQGTAAIIGYVVAAIALITGAMGYCPLWAAFKINTRKKSLEKTA
jgi:hypothetical protein